MILALLPVWTMPLTGQRRRFNMNIYLKAVFLTLLDIICVVIFFSLIAAVVTLLIYHPLWLLFGIIPSVFVTLIYLNNLHDLKGLEYAKRN